MSLYCEIETQFKNADALVAALTEINPKWVGNIEVHENPQYLYGHKGDIRQERAHIIIRRAHVGSHSNDIGFFKQDGRFTAIISEYDAREFDAKWLASLKSEYAFQTISIQQKQRGRIITRERLENGHQRITVKGFR